MQSAKLGRFDEDGTWQNDDREVATFPAPARTPTGSQTVAGPARTRGQTRAAAAATAGTSGTRSTRKHLPRTASSFALFELMSGFSIASGLALLHVGKRIA